MNFGAPPGPPHGTSEERVQTLARLLRMEDRRHYDPQLTSRAAISPDAWLRAKTALSAGRLRDPDASPYLVVLLKDPEPSVRRAAAFGVGLSGDKRLVRFAQKALDDGDAETASNAAEALGKLGNDEAVDALLMALRKPAGPRAAAALALYRFPEKRAIESLLITLEENGLSSDVRKAVVFSLARRPKPEAASALRAVLRKEDEDPLVVSWAARALGILGDAESARDLTRLARTPDVSIAVQALVSLSKKTVLAPGVPGSPDSIAREARSAALERAGDPVPGVAIAALRLLGFVPADDTVRATLEENLLRKGWKGQTALVSLTRLDAASAPDTAAKRVEGAISSDSLELRLGAAEAVEIFSDDRVFETLARGLLADGSARVRAAAITSLSKKNNPGRSSWLVTGLNDADAAVRAAALEAAAPVLDEPSTASPALLAAWTSAYARSFRSNEPDFIVSALDAAADRKTGGKELVLAHVDDAEAVIRDKARRLLVEKFAAKPEEFLPMAVATRFALSEYESFARSAVASLFTADVTTTRGRFTIDLDVEGAPLTVLNFVALARKGYFDRTVIHRVVPDFVIQAGDPRGDGNGGPGYSIRDEINPLRYVRAAVGMALSGPDTGGSQWFVTMSPQLHLDGGYTVFGRVVAGMDTVDHTEQDDRLVSITIAERARAVPPPGAVP